MKECFSPISVPRPNGRGPADRITVPCNACPACDLNRIEDWTNRCRVELDNSDSAFFVTLTYDDEHVPSNELGEISLNKVDYQKFLKRLRKRLEFDRICKDRCSPLKKLRFVVVGEYGHKNKRPHYHLMLFNLPHYGNRTHHEYAVKVIELSWSIDNVSLGQIHVGILNSSSINYMCSYIINPRERYDATRLSRFMETSRRPGIGNQYVERYKSFHQTTDESRLYLGKGEFKRMPQYYARKIWSDQEREHRGVAKKIASERMKQEEQAIALKRGSNEIHLSEARKAQVRNIVSRKLSKK